MKRPSYLYDEILLTPNLFYVMANVYQMVTDRIVEQMSKGEIPWQKPWTCGFGEGLAISYTSRKAYSFLNQLLLGKPGEWLTWKQIQDRKGSVKKGAKSRFVVFYQQIINEVEDEETGEKKKVAHPLLKWYRVFHLDDVEGIESKIKTVEADPGIAPIEEAEKVISEYVEREKAIGFSFINNRESASAYYSPSRDEVVVPMLKQYAVPEEYYSTTFHELTHSTMHEKRCNRRNENKIAAHGDSNYSREELVAELGAAMICNRIGIEAEKAFKNSVAYIQSWMKALKNDPKMIVWASGRAEKATKYILNIAE